MWECTCKPVRRALLVALIATGIYGADVPGTTASSPEEFKIEVTGSAWNLQSHGDLYGSGTTLDFVRDLGFEQHNQMFYGKLVIKPGRKHRIVVEGSPLHVEGQHISTQTFTYEGQSFTINQQLNAKADLTYLYAGYQYDFLSGRAGHLGVSGGAAYMDATGTITSQDYGISSTGNEKFGLPLAGLEFRLFPIPGHSWVDVDGGMRGMDFGGYGYYVEANANVGVWIVNHVGLQAGYREITTFLQDQSRSDNGSLHVRLRGPVFSLAFKW